MQVSVWRNMCQEEEINTPSPDQLSKKGCSGDAKPGSVLLLHMTCGVHQVSEDHDVGVDGHMWSEQT